jgi:hypothetical protein
MEQPQDLVDERFLLLRLLHDEMTPTFLRNFDESVARHILNTYEERPVSHINCKNAQQTFVRLMHKFK